MGTLRLAGPPLNSIQVHKRRNRIHRSSIRNRLKIPNFELLRDVKIRPIPTWFSAASESSCPLGGRLAGKGPHSAAPGARGTRGAGTARGLAGAPGRAWDGGPGMGPGGLRAWRSPMVVSATARGPKGRGSRCEAARAAIRFGGQFFSRSGRMY